MIVKRLLIDC